MALDFLSLQDTHLPGHPSKSIYLDGSPLLILSAESYDKITNSNESSLTPAIGTATILYHWHPAALLALLDIDSWFSFTWNLTLPDSSKLEIGRIRNQITIGELDAAGLWKVMISFNISRLSEDDARYQGPWTPNPEVSMVGERNVEDPAEIDRLGREFVRKLVEERRWLTGKKMKHEFFVETVALGMDPWEDGLAMNPHWLYEGLDLTVCTVCKEHGGESKALNRCGKCGMAAYCSTECQQKDWAVHKGFCGLSAEDRGKALMYSKDGGLANWKGDAGIEQKDEPA